ncbi:hypothetical protein NDU88_006670 [Pleurodeles waltl]|uniref:Uncharacterized protein n=1 Tax=Pleurodeles waltl TaxID=8319 RepID=A0AAV7UM55_PLEWA|nr:hypothetical protein NDU88_006670 [Pleurodeles waltl]
MVPVRLLVLVSFGSHDPGLTNENTGYTSGFRGLPSPFFVLNTRGSRSIAVCRNAALGRFPADYGYTAIDTFVNNILSAVSSEAVTSIAVFSKGIDDSGAVDSVNYEI